MSGSYLGFQGIGPVEPSSLKKVALAKQVGAFLSSDAPEREIAAVLDLVRVLSKDVEKSVRITLAFEVRRCEHVPKDIAIRIAKDISDVASPFLQSTPVLKDKDLADLVPQIAEYARTAIAKRENLGEKAVDAIVEYGEVPSVSQLVRNSHAPMSPRIFSTLYERFQSSPLVLETLARRPDLPIVLVERLVEHVAGAVRETLVDRYDLDEKAAEKASDQAAKITLFTKLKVASLDQVRGFAIELRQDNRLTDGLIINAANEGAVAFVEVAIAMRAGVTISEAAGTLRKGVPHTVIPLLRDAGIARENVAELIRQLAAAYRGNH